MRNVVNFAARARAKKRREQGITLLPPVLDADGYPDALCPNCRGRAFHREPEGQWECSKCEPPDLPKVEEQAGWSFCCMPPSALPTTEEVPQ